MAEVNVSIQALEQVKKSLLEFQAEVEKTTAHMESHIRVLQEECGRSVKQAQRQVEELEDSLKRINKDLEALEEQLARARREGQDGDSGDAAAALKERRRQLEEQRSAVKVTLGKAKDKLENLKRAGKTVEAEAVRLVRMTNQFHSTVLETGSSKVQGIRKCIAFIEEYMAVDMG